MHLMDLDLASPYLRYVFNSISVVCLHYAGLNQTDLAEFCFNIQFLCLDFQVNHLCHYSYFVCLEFNVVCFVNNVEFNYWKKNNTCVITSRQLPRSADMIVAAKIIFHSECFFFCTFSYLGLFTECVYPLQRASLSIKSDRLWHCRLTLAHKHTFTTLLINKKRRGVFFTVTFPVLLEHIVGLLSFKDYAIKS